MDYKRMKKAKTDKGWAGHKLYQYSHYNKDIDTYEDKRQNAILKKLEEKHEKRKNPKSST